MKYSFSTLGCPDWKWSEIIATAKDLGYAGIEIRGIAEDIYAPDIKMFSDQNIKKTLAEIKSLGIEIACLSSSCYLHMTDTDHLTCAKKYVDLGDKLHANGVRVMGEISPEPSDIANDELFIENLKKICSYAENKFPFIYIETNGVYANSDRLLSILKSVNSNKLKVIWDVQHPIRNYNEDINKTYSTLKEYIAHIHIKDSIVVNGKIEYKMVTKGDLPLAEIISILKRDNYQGFVSLEWVKRWNRDLEDPGIVFSNFISTIKSL